MTLQNQVQAVGEGLTLAELMFLHQVTKVDVVHQIYWMDPLSNASVACADIWDDKAGSTKSTAFTFVFTSIYPTTLVGPGTVDQATLVELVNMHLHDQMSAIFSKKYLLPHVPPKLIK